MAVPLVRVRFCGFSAQKCARQDFHATQGNFQSCVYANRPSMNQALGSILGTEEFSSKWLEGKRLSDWIWWFHLAIMKLGFPEKFKKNLLFNLYLDLQKWWWDFYSVKP